MENNIFVVFHCFAETKKHLSFEIWCGLYYIFYGILKPLNVFIIISFHWGLCCIQTTKNSCATSWCVSLHMPTYKKWVFAGMLIRSWCVHGLLTRYVKLRVAHAPWMPGTFFPRGPLQRKPLVSDPGMHVPWCMSGSQWRVKCSRHSRSMRTGISGKWPWWRIWSMLCLENIWHYQWMLCFHLISDTNHITGGGDWTGVSNLGQ